MVMTMSQYWARKANKIVAKYYAKHVQHRQSTRHVTCCTWARPVSRAYWGWSWGPSRPRTPSRSNAGCSRSIPGLQKQNHQTQYQPHTLQHNKNFHCLKLQQTFLPSLHLKFWLLRCTIASMFREYSFLCIIFIFLLTQFNISRFTLYNTSRIALDQNKTEQIEGTFAEYFLHQLHSQSEYLTSQKLEPVKVTLTFYTQYVCMCFQRLKYFKSRENYFVSDFFII